MKRYSGIRKGHTIVVTVDDAPLDPRLDLWPHSPTGFEWGYGGAGPSQLALALVADCCQDEKFAVEIHQEFKEAVVAKLPRQSWTLTDSQIRKAIASSVQ